MDNIVNIDNNKGQPVAKDIGVPDFLFNKFGIPVSKQKFPVSSPKPPPEPIIHEEIRFKTPISSPRIPSPRIPSPRIQVLSPKVPTLISLEPIIDEEIKPVIPISTELESIIDNSKSLLQSNDKIFYL